METKECPHCDAPIGEGVTVCGECGTEIKETGSTPSAESSGNGGNKKVLALLAVLLVVLGGAALLFFTGLIPNPFHDGNTAAIVNGEKISKAELDQKVNMYKTIYSKNNPTDFSSAEGKAVLKNMRSQVLSNLIQEKILLTEARKENVTVTPQEIKERIDAIKKAMNFSDKQFEDFLKSHAMSVSNFEKRTEREALINKLIAKGVQDKGMTKEAWFQELNARAKVEILEKQ